MIIDDYYARLDGPEPLTGLDLVEPDVEFLIALPGTEVAGVGRDALRDYVARRPAVGRRHTVLRRSTDGDLEMVYGVITEGDGRGTGAFTSAPVPAWMVLPSAAFGCRLYTSMRLREPSSCGTSTAPEAMSADVSMTSYKMSGVSTLSWRYDG